MTQSTWEAWVCLPSTARSPWTSAKGRDILTKIDRKSKRREGRGWYFRKNNMTKGVIEKEECLNACPYITHWATLSLPCSSEDKCCQFTRILVTVTPFTCALGRAPGHKEMSSDTLLAISGLVWSGRQDVALKTDFKLGLEAQCSLSPSPACMSPAMLWKVAWCCVLAMCDNVPFID